MGKLEKYYKALNRLIQNNPNIVSKDTKISYDSVSLEAGMSKGCIKKSRPGFSELIEAIDKHKLNKKYEMGNQYKKLNIENLELKKQLNNSLIREINLINEIHELRRNDKNNQNFLTSELAYLINKMTEAQKTTLIAYLQEITNSIR
ncbi:hypothetical protein [Enterobacter ludwigii]|uniref:hypothetical protein n=1 Tax=Enterobacter ludwigii TaxID=299767 RepID=UPI003D64EDF2